MNKNAEKPGVIKVDKNDADKFDEYFEKVRKEGRNLGGLRMNDGWVDKFRYLVDSRIDGDRKEKKSFEELKEDRNSRIGEASSLRILYEAEKLKVEKLTEVQKIHDIEIKKIESERDEWKRNYLGV